MKSFQRILLVLTGFLLSLTVTTPTLAGSRVVNANVGSYTWNAGPGSAGASMIPDPGRTTTDTVSVMNASDVVALSRDLDYIKHTGTGGSGKAIALTELDVVTEL